MRGGADAGVKNFYSILKNSKIAIDYRQSGPRPDPGLLRQAALEALTRSARTDSPLRIGRKRISGDNGPRPDPGLLRQAALEALTRSARTNTPRKTRPERFPAKWRRRRAAHGGGVFEREEATAFGV
ncbi:mediator of RNA polymerase II transcription subunit 15a-like [Dorcoceras hygrometricum]|uniref:Mediator of RNA polymerase II transcription subunit 15a-like n=1 Tax=Dorcoceras hygrometricum TaxID=472368 RepID=A0A2Z7ATE1_9LAMI|nr:mediator of RNA polymerase II transcription subunit 15a-like [Dorcoceras hygrometricum]